jgi:hypothetical protein
VVGAQTMSESQVSSGTSSATHSASQGAGEMQSESHAVGGAASQGQSHSSQESVSASHSTTESHSVGQNSITAGSNSVPDTALISEGRSSSHEGSSTTSEVPLREGSPALEKAIEQHLEKHGLSEDSVQAKDMAADIAATAVTAIGELKGSGGDLAQSELNISTGAIQPLQSSGPHGVSLETLDFVAQKGLSPNGLHELATALGGEAAGMSDLQLAERVSPDAIAKMGEVGFPSEQVAAVQELAATLGSAVGVKDVALTKLEGLDILKEISAPQNADSMLFAEAQPGGEIALGTISKDDFSRNPDMAGASVRDVNDSLAGLDRNQSQTRQVGDESKHEQAEMAMSMSMSA